MAVSPRALSDFLASAFSADELRKLLLNWPDGASVVPHLPTGNAGLADITLAAVEALERRGWCDEGLQERLLEVRPGRAAEIRSLWARDEKATLLQIERLGSDSVAWVRREFSREEQQRFNAALFFREWDDRLSPSRLWLVRRNPEWLKESEALRPAKLDWDNPGAEDGETVHHANLILNFLEDVSIAVESGTTTLQALGEFDRSLRRWWDRLKSIHNRFQGEELPRGWPKAQRLMESPPITKPTA